MCREEDSSTARTASPWRARRPMTPTTISQEQPGPSTTPTPLPASSSAEPPLSTANTTVASALHVIGTSADASCRYQIDLAPYLLPLAEGATAQKFDVEKFCRDLGYADHGYAAKFVDSGFDYLDSILELEEDDLQHIGIPSAAHRSRIMKCIQLFPGYHSRDYLGLSTVLSSLLSAETMSKFIGNFDHLLLHTQQVLPGHEFQDDED